jgi:WD40 repeat protein
MFSGFRRTVGPRDRQPEGDPEPHDDPVGVPCRVRVVTRGLAFMLAAVAIVITYLSQSPPPSSEPAAFAACDGLEGVVKALARPAADRSHYACISNGRLTIWNPRSSHARVGASQDAQIVAAAFAANGSTLAVVDARGVVSLWDLAEWRRWAEIPPRGGMAEALAFSRDSTTLATTDGSGVRLWDVTTANPSAGPRLDLHGVTSLAFAADGRTLVVGTVDGAVGLWDSAHGRQSARFRAHPYHVKSLAISDDGRVLATASPHDRIARLWDAGAGRLLKELDGRSQLQAVAFAPGDRELVTAGFDGTVRLWDVATGDSRWVLTERDGPVSALAFSADGRTLACGGSATIRLYRLDVASQTASRKGG